MKTQSVNESCLCGDHCCSSCGSPNLQYLEEISEHLDKVFHNLPDNIIKFWNLEISKEDLVDHITEWVWESSIDYDEGEKE